MAVRDPEKTLRNKEIDRLTVEINKMVPEVLRLTGYKNVISLNATYGGKHDIYIKIRDTVIDSPEQFFTKYIAGFQAFVEEETAKRDGNYTNDAFMHLKKFPEVLKWLRLFLYRTYLRNYEALSKVRPDPEAAEIWIGEKNAEYGILVTPRFSTKKGQWENDMSEIRHFKPKYWTLGHIIETGFVVPGVDKKITFPTLAHYLDFFESVIVRSSGSIHGQKIAEMYCNFVRSSSFPSDIPLLIPELRYGGIAQYHQYRLDFTIINPINMNKVGFELSPWSTHGRIKKASAKTQKQLNEEARENFEKEIKKQKAYFRKFGIPVLIYSDSELSDHSAIFEEMKAYLSLDQSPKQLEIEVLKALHDF